MNWSWLGLVHTKYTDRRFVYDFKLRLVVVDNKLGMDQNSKLWLEVRTIIQVCIRWHTLYGLKLKTMVRTIMENHQQCLKNCHPSGTLKCQKWFLCVNMWREFCVDLQDSRALYLHDSPLLV